VYVSSPLMKHTGTPRRRHNPGYTSSLNHHVTAIGLGRGGERVERGAELRAVPTAIPPQPTGQGEGMGIKSVSRGQVTEVAETLAILHC